MGTEIVPIGTANKHAKALAKAEVDAQISTLVWRSQMERQRLELEAQVSMARQQEQLAAFRTSTRINMGIEMYDGARIKMGKIAKDIETSGDYTALEAHQMIWGCVTVRLKDYMTG